jgi:CRP/FNR family cyclic AMP-dependent transcriptional regulator
MSGVPRRVRVVEAFPEIVENLDPGQQELARRQLVADLIVAKTGRWTPHVKTDVPGHLGLLVLDGLLSRDVILEKPLATELVGQGDLLQPSDCDGEGPRVPFGVTWTVLEPTRLAVLDPAFARALGQWPPAMAAVLRGASNRAHSLAITLAVSNLRRVDVRLLMLLWYLAERWGRVTPEGVVVPLRLTHETLARLVGAQRPSVTTAIRQLEDEEHLRRTPDRLWLLRGDPPEPMARPAAAASLGN